METPWYAAYPAPRNQTPKAITRQELLQGMRDGWRAGGDFLIIDLRRNDHEGGTIRGSFNLPAQSLYHSLPALCDLCVKAGVKKVIFFCRSSRGRGTRAAGWLDDLLSDRQVVDVQSMILLDGIKGWANGGEEYTQMMDGYQPEPWEKFR